MDNTSKYPALRWNTAGDVLQINSLEEDDPDLLNHHPDDPAYASAPAKFKPADVMRLLTEGNVPFNKSDFATVKRSLLTAALLEAVKASGRDVPADADAETLYAILQAAQ